MSIIFAGLMLAQAITSTKPPYDQPQTVTAGSTVYEKETTVGAPAVALLNDVTFGTIFGNVTIKRGEPLQVQEGESKMIACTSEASESDASCLIDQDRDGVFDRHRPATAMVSVKLKTPAAYERVAPLGLAGAGSTKQTLIYLGVSGSTLRLSYREYANDFARPAFTEEVTFTLSGSYPETVAYKDLVIDVLGVSNAGLRYVVRGKGAPGAPDPVR